MSIEVLPPAPNPLPLGWRQVSKEELRAIIYKHDHPTTVNELIRRARKQSV